MSYYHGGKSQGRKLGFSGWGIGATYGGGSRSSYSGYKSNTNGIKKNNGRAQTTRIMTNNDCKVTALRALKIAQNLKRNREIKQTDRDFTLLKTTGVSQVFDYEMCNIPQGTDDNKRIGDNVSLMSLTCKGFIICTGIPNDLSDALSTGMMRVVFFVDRRPATTPVWGDLFQTDKIHSLYSNKGPNRGRFQVFHDSFIPLTHYRDENQPGSKNVGRPKMLNIYKTWKKELRVRHKTDVTTGGFASIESNAICMVIKTQWNISNTTVTPTVAINMQQRVKYTDA